MSVVSRCEEIVANDFPWRRCNSYSPTHSVVAPLILSPPPLPPPFSLLLLLLLLLLLVLVSSLSFPSSPLWWIGLVDLIRFDSIRLTAVG